MSDLISDIDRLSAEQATRAVGLFYDLAPAACWEGGLKPPVARIQKVARDIRNQAPEDAQAFVDGLFDKEKGDARGELSRLLLTSLSNEESLRHYVAEAVALAVKPTMAVDPLSLALICGVLVLSARIKTVEQGDKKTTEASGLAAVISALQVDKIVKGLPAIIKATPAGVLAKLIG